MTVGEESKKRMLESSSCYLIDGIYYYVDKRKKEAVVLKADACPTHLTIPDTITIPNSHISWPVSYIHYKAFANSNIEDVEIGQNVKIIDTAVFQGCAKLRVVKLPRTALDLRDQCFSGCISLNTINLKYVGKIYSRAFYGCKSLDNITLSQNIETIPASAFNSCSNLTNITIPSSVKEIGYEAFEWCENLKEIELPASVLKIDTEAFRGCSSLKRITINNPSIRLDWECFSDCSSLETIDFPNDNMKIDGACLINCFALDDNTLRHIEHTSLEQYIKESRNIEEKEAKRRERRKKLWYKIYMCSTFILVCILALPLVALAWGLIMFFASLIGTAVYYLSGLLIAGLLIAGFFKWLDDL